MLVIIKFISFVITAWTTFEKHKWQKEKWRVISKKEKKTVSKIKQNLFWAFAYNTGLIPIAGGALVPFLGVGIFGWLPMLAGIAMAMSSLTVVGNSVLLGRYKPRIFVKKSQIEGSRIQNKNEENQYVITRWNKNSYNNCFIK